MQLGESELLSRVPMGQKMDALSSKLFQQGRGLNNRRQEAGLS